MAFLKFQNITKRFPGVTALDDVSFEIERGSCHALIGENGAGKSTLGKILAGIHTADSGKIFLNESEIYPANPLDARKLGIAIVHQELAFCPNLSVAENLCLGDLPSRCGFVNREQMREKAAAMLREIGAEIDVNRPICELSTGQEQLVQIAAAIGISPQRAAELHSESASGNASWEVSKRPEISSLLSSGTRQHDGSAKIIVMDEPTSSLSASESERFFRVVKNLKSRGITLIYVSHRMEEIFHLCDSLTVLRDGRHVATEKISETNPERVIHQMVGREVLFQQPKHLENELGNELLRVENFSSPGKFLNIGFTLRAGEILGFAGLIGAGRSEMAQAIFGLDARATGKLFVRGKELPLGSVDASLAAGIGLVPEDRKRLGLVLSMNCRENSSLAALNRLSRFGFVKRREEKILAQKYGDRLRVKTASMESLVAALSGGNQQKIALAKWLARECEILFVDEPTRGIDVGAKAEIYQLLDELACAGLGVAVISSDLPEVMNLSRRILVLREGKLAGEVLRDDFSQPNLMRLMAGVGN